MARLTSAARKRIPGSKFGLPKERAYPVNDPNHARNAKARASEEERKGKLTKRQEAEIDRAADRVLKPRKMK